jgi:hypothetical protein
MKTLFAALVTAGFLGMTAFEVHHDLIRRAAWPGYAPIAGAVVFLLAPCWLLGAASVWSRQPWGWAGLAAGAFASVAHGVGVRAGGSMLGTAFILAGPALLVLSALARRRPAAPAASPATPEREREPREVAPAGRR